MGKQVSDIVGFLTVDHDFIEVMRMEAAVLEMITEHSLK